MFTVIGRRWFEKVNGNTYHSVAVYRGKELIGKVDFAYGYGDHYKQTAFDIVRKFGFYSDKHLPSGGYKDYGQFLQDSLCIVTNVSRKGDLKE